MKDICPFCELPEPLSDVMTFETDIDRVQADCQRCPHCHRRYFTTAQVRKVIKAVFALARELGVQKTGSERVLLTEEH